MSKKQNLWDLAQCLLFRIRDDEISALSAQLTYYLILAFFPFLILLTSVISYVQLSGDEIIWDWIRILPQDTQEIVSKSISEVSGEKSRTLLSVGMIATIWAASNGINAIIKGLNRAYDEEENRPYWKVRSISILATIVLAIVILLLMATLIFGKAIGAYLFEQMQYPDGFNLVWGVLKFVVPLVAMLGVFTLLFWITPNRRLTIKEVFPGAVFTTLGWICTSLLFSFYVSHFGNYSKTYGNLGGVIVLLVWLYISSIMVLLGGEVNATLAFNRSGMAKPTCKSFGLSIPFINRLKKS